MKVLFCTDGSAMSRLALEAGARLFKGRRVEGVLLHVLPEVDERLAHYERLHEEELKEIEKLFGGGEETLQIVTQAQKLLAKAGLRTRRKIRRGEPGQEILKEIREGKYDLVILGSHGKRGLSRFLLGSVSQEVSRSAPISVLVVKAPLVP
jgi:nucleotide-binding universal stress UspA family protein